MWWKLHENIFNGTGVGACDCVWRLIKNMYNNRTFAQPDNFERVWGDQLEISYLDEFPTLQRITWIKPNDWQFVRCLPYATTTTTFILFHLSFERYYIQNNIFFFVIVITLGKYYFDDANGRTKEETRINENTKSKWFCFADKMVNICNLSALESHSFVIKWRFYFVY